MKAARTPGRVLTLLGVGATLLLPDLAAAKDRYEEGESVPVFTLKVLNKEDAGETYISLDKYYGATAKDPKKAILLSFFATYCGPCKKEIPYLSALYDLYKDRGLQILLISIDKDAPKIDEAKELASRAAVKFPLLTDRFNIVARRYYIEKLPCVYVLNSDGKVAMVNIGYGDTAGRQMLDEVRQQIGEPLSDPIPQKLQALLSEEAPPAAGGDGGADLGDSEAASPTAKSDAGASGETASPAGSETAAAGDAPAAAATGTESAATTPAVAPVATKAAEPKAKKKKKKKRKKRKKRKRKR